MTVAVVKPVDMKTAEIVEVYNQIADRPVKKFESRNTAIERLVRLLEDRGMEVVVLNGVLTARVAGTEVDEAEDTEEMAPVDMSHLADSMPPVVAAAVATGQDWLIRRPSPEQRRSTNTNPVGRPTRGRHSGHPESWRIEVISATNPKKVGSRAAARFDCYGRGCTVGEFLDRCHTLGHYQHRHQCRADIHWDIAHGFIRVVEPRQ